MGENGSEAQCGASKASGLATALCAVLGLAFMFGGIWLADAQLLGASSSEAGTLAMRVCTCAVYCLFYAVAAWYSHGDGDVRWMFGASAVLGLVLFTIGALMTFLVMPQLESGGAAWTAVGMLALLSTKTVGAPLSVGLVCLFARLGRAMVVRSCTLGMLGAFALYSLVSQSGPAAALGPEGIVVVAGLFLAVALLLAMVGFGGAPSRLKTGKGAAVHDVLAVPGVVKRPIAKVVTPGFVIMLVFSAMMLGFLRNGFTGGDFHNDPVTFVALIALLALAFAWRGLRIEHVFYGALLSTAVGILLAPSVAWALPGLDCFMCGLGTALFEVVSWALVVWAARNSVETLRAASGMRLAATVGHLLGTVVVAVGMLLAATSADALFASEQLMVFIYMVLLVVLLKFPGLQAPFATASDASEYNAESIGPVRADAGAGAEASSSMAAVADEGSNLQQPVAVQPQIAPAADASNAPAAPDAPDATATGDSELACEQPPATDAQVDPLSKPCDTIARTYRLTAREREVLGLIAHGRNMPFMENELVISRNTLKMHIRHVYTKLDVHSKQEIIDMVEALIAR